MDVSGPGCGGFVDAASEQRFRALHGAAMASWPDHVSATVATGFGPTEVFRAGAGQGVPFLLLPGGAGTAASWAPVAGRLAATGPVIGVDTLGDAGLSRQTRPIRDADDYADWLSQVITGLDLHRVHLVGSSYGGWLTLNQAIRRPESLASITAIEPARALAGLSVGAWLRMIGLLATRTDRYRLDYLTWVRAGRAPASPMRELLVSALADYRKGTVPPPLRIGPAELARIEVPTVIMIGGRSPMHHPARAAAQARAGLPGAVVEIIEDASHGLAAEEPDRIVARLRTLAEADPS